MNNASPVTQLCQFVIHASQCHGSQGETQPAVIVTQKVLNYYNCITATQNLQLLQFATLQSANIFNSIFSTRRQYHTGVCEM